MLTCNDASSPAAGCDHRSASAMPNMSDSSMIHCSAVGSREAAAAPAPPGTTAGERWLEGVPPYAVPGVLWLGGVLNPAAGERRPAGISARCPLPRQHP